MAPILWILGGAFALAFAAGEWARMRERISPLRYRNVPWIEIEGHIRDFARRGFDRCQMIILGEGTGNVVRLRKTIESLRGFRVNLIAENKAPTREGGQSCLKKIFDAQGIPFGYGPGGFRSNRYGVFAKVGDDIDLATRAAKSILSEFYGFDAEHTYSVWIRGDIDSRDICIDSVWVPGFASMLVVPYRLGRPYKRYQIPDRSCLSYWLGQMVGALLHLIRRVLGRR